MVMVAISTKTFQPTLPVRGATEAFSCEDINPIISTHAPRAGSDGRSFHSGINSSNFNPRSPCGERLFPVPRPFITIVFQPTLPVRGATRNKYQPKDYILFQPTLPVRGATNKSNDILDSK